MKTINYYVNEKLTLYHHVNEKLKLNSQSQLKNEYGDNWEDMCRLLYDKMYEWHQEYSKKQKLLRFFILWLQSDIDSMTDSGNSGYDIYQNIVSELLNTNRISQEEYDNFLNHKDKNKIVEFCLFIMIKIINNPNQMMKSFSETMKESKKHMQ